MVFRFCVLLSTIYGIYGFAGLQPSRCVKTTRTSRKARIVQQNVDLQALPPKGNALHHARGTRPHMSMETENQNTAPKLKRVRRRRKDGSAGISAEKNQKVTSTADQEIRGGTKSAYVAAELVLEQSGKASAAEIVDTSNIADDGSPQLSGGTKGMKVRVDAVDEVISEDLVSAAAAAASNAIGEAVSTSSEAARTIMGSARNVFGKETNTAGGESGSNTLLGGSRRQAQLVKNPTDLEDLGADIARFREKESAARQSKGMGDSFALGFKDLISTIITVDFFVVIAFMLWFIAGVVLSYGFQSSFLLDEFNQLWTPLVQPALGVLMGGTIAGGVISKLRGSEDEGNDQQQRR